MSEKTLEFNSIKEFGNSKDVNAENVIGIQMHYDKIKEKYITTITYGKK